MCDRLELRPPFGSNRKHPGHEPRQTCAGRRNVEIAFSGFNRDNRCKRAEWLAVLDLAVEPIAHFGRMGRCEDATVAKRARPELKSALHPPNDAVGRQIASDLIDERAIRKSLEVVTVFLCYPSQLG